MTDDQPETITIPTELNRADGFYDLAALFGSGLMAWWLVSVGAPLWLPVPFVLLIAVWTLTGEPAADVPYLGVVASVLRSRLGLRRAHEWLLAWGHYFRIRTWPDFKEWTAATGSRWQLTMQLHLARLHSHCARGLRWFRRMR